MKINRSALLVALLATGLAKADITFNFTYQDQIDSSGFGFDDSTEGAKRRATVSAVGDYLNTVLDENGSVDLLWLASTNEPSGSTLGAMGSSYFTNQGVDDGLVFKHITTGVDPLGGEVDGGGRINFGRNWNSDHTATTGGSEFDLFTVVLHEITHALGVSSLIDETDGSAEIEGTYSRFDTFLSGPSGDFLTGSTFTGNVADLTSDAVKFTTLNDGDLDIYSPDPYVTGSSISHLDFTHNAVMNPAISPGVEKRTFSAQDLALLETIGYDLVAVPEPGTTVLLGFAAFGFVLRRRR